MPAARAWEYRAAMGTTSGGWFSRRSTGPARASSSDAAKASPSPRTRPRWIASSIPRRSWAPNACETIGSSAMSIPIPKTEMPKKYRLPSATAAKSGAETRPTMAVSTMPWNTKPT